MNRRQSLVRCAAVSVCIALSWGPSVAQQRAEASETVPETVMVTLHAKPGAEADLERVLANHWKTARELRLVRDAPHVTIRGSEEANKTYFVEIFTWRDANVPDSAPAEIQKIWTEMNRLVEARGGHPGLEFVAVSAVAP
jgi:hypothetical protein